MIHTLQRFLALGSALVFPALAPSAFGQLYHQNFESNADGIQERQFDTDTVSNINRVASGGGHLGAASASAGFHLEIGLINENGHTGFGFGASANDSPASGTFTSGMGVSVRTYLDDPNRLLDGGGNVYEPGDGWFFQPTLHRPDGDPPISAGGFGVQLSGDREWTFAATGNKLGGFEYGLHNGDHPQNGSASFPLGETFAAGSEGWYRLETLWIANGTGGVDQVNNVYNPSEVLVFSATVENAVADMADAGAPGPLWFGQDGPREPNEFGYSGNLVPQSLMGDLAIDDVTVIPEPATVAGAFGAVSILFAVFVRRRRNARPGCVKH